MATETVFQQAHATLEAAKTGYLAEIEAHSGDVAAMNQKLADPFGRTSDLDASRNAIAHSDTLRSFADTDSARAIDKAVESVRARRDQAEAHIAKIRADLSPDGDTATELRATRFWTRTKEVLDSLQSNGGPDHTAIRNKVEQVIASAKPADLGTLLQEIDAYCEARRFGTAGWLDHALGQVVPDYVRAKQTLQRANQALTMTEANARTIQKAIASGHAAPLILAQPHAKYDPDK